MEHRSCPFSGKTSTDPEKPRADGASGCPAKKLMEADLIKARAEAAAAGGGPPSGCPVGQSSGCPVIPPSGISTVNVINSTNTVRINTISSSPTPAIKDVSNAPSEVTIKDVSNAPSEVTIPSSDATRPIPVLEKSQSVEYSATSHAPASSSGKSLSTGSAPLSIGSGHPAMRKISPPPILTHGRKVSPPNPNHVKFTTQVDDVTNCETNSEPSNYGSGEGSPRMRKTSNISTTSSLGSEPDSDLGGEKKVDVRSLIEGIGTLIIPAVSCA